MGRNSFLYESASFKLWVTTQHSDLSGVGVSDHHVRYTDAEADIRAALQDHDHSTPISAHASISAAHHARYENSEAVSAMGAVGNANTYNHTSSQKA